MYSLMSLLQFLSGRPAADVTDVPTEEDGGVGQGEALQSNEIKTVHL